MSNRRSISTLLIAAVNLPMVIILMFLLPWDYYREMENAIAQKQRSLGEEAMTIYLGLSILPQQRQQVSVQRYLDAVCVRLHDSRSPSQHIVARWNGKLYFSRGHEHPTPEFVELLLHGQQDPNGKTSFGSQNVVVGSFGDNNVGVYVSESTTSILASIRREILLHLAMLGALAMTAAAIVNLVLWRIVARPVQQLSSRVTRIGKGEYNLVATRFVSHEMNELSDVIHQMAESLARSQQEQSAQMVRAQRIQEHLLPRGVAVPGLALAYLFEPAEGIAGDYYDVIPLDDRTWLICIADVAGHGVSAAMGSAMLKALVMHATERHRKPHEILGFVNQRLPALLPDEMVTMFLGRWHPDVHRLDYASAGHEPGIFLLASGESHQLDATGIPLGIEPEGKWDTESLRLNAGEQIILTTDGVVEASNTNGELFGRGKLAEIIAKCASRSPIDTVDAIRQEIYSHQGSEKQLDDITILAIEATQACDGSKNAHSQERDRNLSASV